MLVGRGIELGGQQYPSSGSKKSTTTHNAGGMERSNVNGWGVNVNVSPPSAQTRHQRGSPFATLDPDQNPTGAREPSIVAPPPRPPFGGGVQVILPGATTTTAATSIHNEFKTTTSHNEERLEVRMAGMSLATTDTKSPMYQEHVCAEDFYKQPRKVYESVVVITKERGMVETEALGGDRLGDKVGASVNEEGRTGSSTWKFESAVVWNDGGRREKGGYETNGGGRKVENEQVVPVPTVRRVESQGVGQTRRVDIPRGASATFNIQSIRNMGTKASGNNGSVDTRTGRQGASQDLREPKARESRSSKNIPPTAEKVAQSRAVDLPAEPKRSIDPEAQGNEIRRKIQSNNGGWKFAFELFELGKVPDAQSFLMDVLEEFANRRPQYWDSLRRQGFDVDKYRKSDDDDLFLQTSYTSSVVEALQKGDVERAGDLLEKAWIPLERRFQKQGHQWILDIENMELVLYGLHIFMKQAKVPGSTARGARDRLVKHMECGDDFEVSDAGRTPEGIKYFFQFHFMVSVLRDVNERYAYATKWLGWKIHYRNHPDQESVFLRIVEDMQGIEVLRYAVEKAASGSTGGWNDRPEVLELNKVSAGYLSWFASVGHKEVILKNLESLYDLKTVLDWNPKMSSPPMVPPKPTKSSAFPAAPRLPQSPSRNLPERLAPRETGATNPKSPPAPPRRQGSIRHPSPWESGSPSSSGQSQARRPSGRSIPEETTTGLQKDPLFSPISPVAYDTSAWAITPPKQSATTYDTSAWARTPPKKPGATYDPNSWAMSLPPPDKEAEAQRTANLRDQPVRFADDCTVDEINVITDYKQAVRNSPNLDVYIGTLASLRLINFISGNPEYRPWTPLIEAICNQRWEAARVLIRLGASFDLGYPFHTALSRHFMDGSRSRCAKLVDRKIIDTGGFSIEAYFFTKSSGLIHDMIDYGVDVNRVGTANTDLESQIKTCPIHLAALDRVSTSSLVWAMLERGANVWATDANGELAIDYARRAGNKEVIEELERAMTQK
ncbi:hypothetical protein TWF281_001568 [Arthrobotrys megalospora]